MNMANCHAITRKFGDRTAQLCGRLQERYATARTTRKSCLGISMPTATKSRYLRSSIERDVIQKILGHLLWTGKSEMDSPCQARSPSSMTITQCEQEAKVWYYNTAATVPNRNDDTECLLPATFELKIDVHISNRRSSPHINTTCICPAFLPRSS